MTITQTIYDSVESEAPPEATDFANGPNSHQNKYGDGRKFFKIDDTMYVF